MLGRFTATGMVIACMVGTGVFVSLGYQASSLNSTFAILLLWVLGGIYAFCGAVCYAELASRMPRSGGEYHFLTKIYHPALGFLAGWISVVVGFAAPTAVAAIVVGKYTSYLLGNINEIWISTTTILLCGCIHFCKPERGCFFQNCFTIIKISLLIGFTATCFFVLSNPHPIKYLPQKVDVPIIFSMDFATAFVWATFSYSGWNAAVYVSGEMKDARRSVPYSLLIATLIVTSLYLLLNISFMHSIPFQEIIQLDFITKSINDQSPEPYEIAALAADQIFSGYGHQIARFLISIGLVSTIGAFVYIGPRISQTIGEDFTALSFLSYKNKNGTPIIAIFLQILLSLTFVFSADLKSIVLYVEFSLILFSTLTVFGLFLLRFRDNNESDAYRAWGFPWSGLFFLVMSIWVLVSVMISYPWQSLASIITILIGFFLFCVSKPKKTSL